MKLTQTVKKGGCAAKVPALILKEILSGIKFPPVIPGVEVDGSHFDDAAIFKINDETALVQTLDFFTPIVDSPADFGAIAAANALSDVYAMGGKPKTCMAILAAPLAVLDQKVIQEVLQGACDVITRSGSSLVGGHSIDDDTLKFGLSVTGTIHPQKLWTNQTAKVGDVLVLTKPLGTGTICAGIKRQELPEAEAAEAIASMKRINNAIDFLTPEELRAVHAATDVTGFGLAGHAFQLSLASGVSLKLSQSKLPVFKKTIACLEKGLLTKAHASNEAYTREKISFGAGVSSLERLVHFDPQTSGGLLLSVAPEVAAQVVGKLAENFPGTAAIGTVIPRESFHVFVD